jgi:hypothetical protein
MAGPRRPAAAPTVTPVPYGLLSVAEQATDLGDAHWRNGVQIQPDSCGPAQVTDARCLSSGHTKVPTGSLPTRAADPFAVYSYIACAPIGYGDFAEVQTRARNALLLNEGPRVEHTFWTGGVDAVSPHLAANAAITEGVAGSTEVVTLQTAATVIATGVPYQEAMGLLEGALASCYGGLGVIHAPRWTLDRFKLNTGVDRDGSRFRAGGGTPVAFGAGYPGTGPNGAAAAVGHAWLYATGAVRYWRSDVEFTAGSWAEAIERSVNDTVPIAERVYVIDWDCCHFAIEVEVGTVSPPLVGD